MEGKDKKISFVILSSFFLVSQNLLSWVIEHPSLKKNWDDFRSKHALYLPIRFDYMKLLHLALVSSKTQTFPG